MSRVAMQKYIMNEMYCGDFEAPKDNQQIVRIVSSRGNNLHEVEPSDDSENYLVSMPKKFRKNVWVKRGDFVLVEPIEEGEKVKAEIVKILTQTNIKELTKQGIWPKKFTKKREREEDEGDDLLLRNVNRPHLDDTQSEDEEEKDDSSSCDSD